MKEVVRACCGSSTAISGTMVREGANRLQKVPQRQTKYFAFIRFGVHAEGTHYRRMHPKRWKDARIWPVFTFFGAQSLNVWTHAQPTISLCFLQRVCGIYR
jgi:hypothetical protein